MRKFYAVVLLLGISASWWGCGSRNMSQDDLDDPLAPKKAPPRIYVGPVAGFNRSMHGGGLKSSAGGVPCPQFDIGTENGFYAGMTAEYLLGNPKDANSSIIARLMYDYQPAYFNEPEDKALPSRFGTTTGETNIEHVTEVKYALLNFEVMYRWNIPGTYFGFTAGPQIGFPISSNLTQEYNLVLNSNNPAQFVATPDELAATVTEGFAARYKDDSRTSITLYDGKVINQSGMRAAIKAGVQYEILLNRFILVPAVYYNFGLTKVTTTDNWSISALQIGADLRFAL